MRDPERIDNILNIIRLIWTDCPDLRLGQLIVNSVGLGVDLFDVEDDILRGKLIEFGLEFCKDKTENRLIKEAKGEKIMVIADMTVLSTTSDGKCPLCVRDVPADGYHICSGGFKVIDHNHLQRPIDSEILAELKEIRNLLEAIRAEKR